MYGIYNNKITLLPRPPETFQIKLMRQLPRSNSHISNTEKTTNAAVKTSKDTKKTMLKML